MVPSLVLETVAINEFFLFSVVKENSRRVQIAIESRMSHKVDLKSLLPNEFSTADSFIPGSPAVACATRCWRACCPRCPRTVSLQGCSTGSGRLCNFFVPLVHILSPVPVPGRSGRERK